MITVLLVCFVGVAAQATLIDDFSNTDVSEYTSTAILDAGGTGSNAYVVEAPSGVLQVNTTAYDGIEQMAIIRNGLSLAVGEEVQLQLTSHSGISYGIGLYVGIAPTTGVRQDYLCTYASSDVGFYSSGFNGTSHIGSSGFGGLDWDGVMFIARVATSDYEVGYYASDGTRVVVSERDGYTGNDAAAVGIYTDVRAEGVMGYVDNLTVIPEPATMVLLGLGSLLGLRKRK